MVVSNDSTIEIRSTRSEMPAVTTAKSWMKPGLMPLPKMVEPPRSHASTTRARALAQAVAVDELGGGDDVDARAENADQDVHIGEHRVVDDAVRPQREQRVDIVRGCHTQRFDTAEFADVLADFVGRPGVAPDEFQIRVGGDGMDRLAADVARRPLHDPVGHAVDRSPGVNTTGTERNPRVTELP